MRILEVEDKAFEQFPYWIVPPGGERDAEGNRKIECVPLPIYKGMVDGLPAEIDALIVTSDLQGKVIEEGQEYLLGEKLPAFLALCIELEFPLLQKQQVGVLLCGDLYATLQKRGGSGDVKEVWRAFRKEFRWVAGVAGNHDEFGSSAAFEAFKREEGLYFIQHEVQKVEQVTLGGISGVIGSTNKLNRVDEEDYLAALRQVLRKQPDAVLLHQSPDHPGKELPGSEKIRTVLQASSANLIFCGHSHWKQPLATLENGTQVLNIDSRVVILINATLQSLR